MNRIAARAGLPWLLIAAAFAALFIPTLYKLLTGIWATQEQGHGFFILLISAWLIWRHRAAFWSTPEQPAPVAGWSLFLVGMLLYIVGSSQDILTLEVGAAVWLLCGVIILMRGPAALKPIWFALVFMLFMIPLPGAVVDALTQPMKLGVSVATEHLLYTMGYPIARDGVILQMGQYQLLVADACAGLHTVTALLGMGLLYLYLVRSRSIVRNVVVVLLIVPIAFAANIVRVMAIALITFHFGDEAGQGFLHEFAGFVLFAAALLLIMGIDSLMGIITRKSKARAAP